VDAAWVSTASNEVNCGVVAPHHAYVSSPKSHVNSKTSR
jgi:hypothetical protein